LSAVKRRQILELGLFAIIRIILFILISIFLVALSWRPLQNPRSHGFYRFFAFEGVLIIVLLNIPFWFRKPISPLQLISWTFLFFSTLFVVQGFYLLKKLGGSAGRETGSENLPFENTVNLVTDGIYKYIRHPMYSSLLLLAWAALLKHVTIYGILAVLITTAFLVATAKMEERENISFFGSSYEEYIKRTKMFIPYLF
jgi:protein-S-isoprenylcysteine O-methyltransferase Ste14